MRASSTGRGTDDQAIAVTVTNVNEAPTDFTVTGGTIQEDVLRPAGPSYDAGYGGLTVATLAGVDPDAGDTFTYAITGGDSAKYEIVGNEIRVRSALTSISSLMHQTA